MFDLGRTLFAAAARNPAALAMVDGELRLTYRELLDRALRIVNGLDQLGLGHGDRLLIVLQNRVEFAILHWATQLAGIVATPVNWRANAEELAFFIENSEAKALAYEPVSSAAVKACATATAMPRIAIGLSEPGTTSFDEMLQSQPATDCPRAAADDVSLMLYTDLFMN